MQLQRRDAVLSIKLKDSRAYIVVGPISAFFKTHIFSGKMVLTFDPYILVHILSLMFNKYNVAMDPSIKIDKSNKSKVKTPAN